MDDVVLVSRVQELILYGLLSGLTLVLVGSSLALILAPRNSLQRRADGLLLALKLYFLAFLTPDVDTRLEIVERELIAEILILVIFCIEQFLLLRGRIGKTK